MRKSTPDILSALMGDEIKQESNTAVMEERNKPVEQENNKAINTESNKTVKQAISKTVKQPSKKKPVQTHFVGMEPSEGEAQGLEIPKEKATFNLSKNILRELEDCWIEIRRLRGDKRVSKTDIVEQALEDAIKEFGLKKQLSKFYGKLESNKTIKQ